MSVKSSKEVSLDLIAKYSQKLAVAKVARDVANMECEQAQNLLDRSQANLTQAIRDEQPAAE